MDERGGGESGQYLSLQMPLAVGGWGANNFQGCLQGCHLGLQPPRQGCTPHALNTAS